MTTVKELYDLTKELCEFLETSLPKEDREPYIEMVESLLQKREELVSGLKEPSDRQEQEMALSIVEWNKTIQQQLASYLAVIKADMNKLKLQKQTGMKYENPNTTQPDGFFIDKKN
ncbi:hypothetical protein RJD24_19450 [Bacillaceae bacterium IKA-2]|nr:hypothetical protein RJD24_19450 [Bacillaceae bacterium IKA-2]